MGDPYILIMADAIIPIGSMYGIFMYITYIYQNMVCLHLHPI